MRHYSTRFKVQNFVSGTGNTTVTFTSPIMDLVFISDDTSDITLTLHGVDWTMNILMKNGDVIDEFFRDIVSLDIAATGAWRYYVRSEQKQ